MPWTVYRWDDAGAPTSTGVAGSLINLLDACLVTGYGTKPAAGWTKPFTGTDKAVFQQGAGSNGMYLRVDNTSTTQPRVVGYKTMSDVDTGTIPFPTEAQASGGGYATITSGTANSTQRPWVLAADSKRFFLYVGQSNTTAEGLVGTTPGVGMFFGDTVGALDVADTHNTLIVCGTLNPYPGLVNIVSTSTIYGLTGHYMAGTKVNVAGSVAAGKGLEGASSTGFTATTMGATSGARAYPDPLHGGLGLLRVPVASSEAYSVWRGFLPGIWCPTSNMFPYRGDTLQGSAGGGLSGKEFLLLYIYADGSSGAGVIALETSNTVG